MAARDLTSGGERAIAPFGSWPSPFPIELLARGAVTFGEISSIVKRGDRLLGAAKDPITVRLALEEFVPDRIKVDIATPPAANFSVVMALAAIFFAPATRTKV